MKKLLLLLLFVLSFSYNSYAQTWDYYKDLPLNITPLDVDINNAGTIYLLTTDGKIYYKLLNQQWIKMNTSGLGLSPTCITAEKTSNFFFYGDPNGALLYTSDFGVTWENVFLYTSPITGFHEGIYALSNMKNFDMLYGSSGGGSIIRYTPASTDELVFDAIDPGSNVETLYYTVNNKLIIGTINNGIWLSSNNGLSFVHTNFNQNNVSCITEGNNGRVYALSTNNSTNVSQIVFSDDYINWSNLGMPTTAENFTNIFFNKTDNNLWLASTTAIYKILLTPTTSTTWTLALFNNASQNTTEIIGSSTGLVYNFSDINVAQRLDTNASNWTKINNGFIGDATSVTFGQVNKLFAFSNVASSLVSTATSTTTPWDKFNISNTNTPVVDIISHVNGKLYVSFTDKIFKSVDNGLIFTDISPTNGTNFCRVFSVGETENLFAVKSLEENKLYWSQNDGATWSLLAAFPNDSGGALNSLVDVSQDSNGVIYVLRDAIEQSTGEFQVFFSMDSGVNWLSETLFDTSSSSFSNLFSKNDKTFVTIGNKTYQFGITSPGIFTEVNKPADFVTNSFALTDLKVNSLGHYYTFGRNLYKSINNGATWTNLGKPTAISTNNVDALIFDNSNACYILNSQFETTPNQKGIYKFNDNLSTDHFNAKIDLVVVPNPAIDFITIQTDELINQIDVYDLLGKKVVNDLSNLKSINVNNLTNGLYIIKATTADNKTLTTKFIKE